MFAASLISYKETNSFTKIVLDYLEGKDELQSFYSFTPTIEGIKEVIEQKKKQQINRTNLVSVLKEQYANVPAVDKVNENIEALQNEKTFTVCTAHQPNLFTGPLYFIYKILHAIKLAEDLKNGLPEYNFVPVFYMGSEDADLNELNHFTVRGKKYVWETGQTGAVGRMKIDKQLMQLIDELEQQLAVEQYGKEWIQLLRSSFTIGKDIQTATFELVHALFSSFGLVVLIPDNKVLKSQMSYLVKDEILAQKSIDIVTATSERLSKHYNVQAFVRPINLFYLIDNVRERIEAKKDSFSVVNTDISFTADEIKNDIEDHPDRFSPNVILRGLYQEVFLPNIAFVGGGGEVAYWLQLKDLFDHYAIPFPIIVLRNSFLIIENKHQELIQKLGINSSQLFDSELDILNSFIEREGKKPHLNGEVEKLNQLYDILKVQASTIDPSLQDHVDALKTKATKQITELEKKMLRAERKKHEATGRQLAKLKHQLFPNENLQERVENIGGYYAKWGSKFIKELYKNSPALEQKFVILTNTD